MAAFEAIEIRRDRCISRRASGSCGVLSTAELRSCGLTHDAIMRRARRGLLIRLHRGVYAVGHVDLTTKARILAAVKACGTSAVASHVSAGWLWGLVERAGARPEVVVQGSGARLHPGIDAHRTSHLDSQDRDRARGVPVTSPARTLVDLAGRFAYRPLRRAVRQAQSLQLVSALELLAAIERLGPRAGTGKLARILAGGPAPTRSELEDVVLDLLLGGGFAPPAVNRPLLISGRRVIPDFRWPERAIVVEADSRTWHDNPTARADDAERQALLEAHGDRVIRVTWEQAVRQPRQTLTRLRRAGVPTIVDADLPGPNRRRPTERPFPGGIRRRSNRVA
jgi:predicted transcriptional regulator of viral defense system